jgi:hypothetical protein
MYKIYFWSNYSLRSAQEWVKSTIAKLHSEYLATLVLHAVEAASHVYFAKVAAGKSKSRSD